MGNRVVSLAGNADHKVLGFLTETKCMFTAAHLVEIYEQYKEASGHMIAQMALHERYDKNGPSELHNSLVRAFEGFDFSNLTIGEALKLGMCSFYDQSDYDYIDNIEEETDVLFLFPLWMFPILPRNIELTNIFGIKTPPIKGIAMNDDTRNGFLSYGMMYYQFKYRKVLVEKYKRKG